MKSQWLAGDFRKQEFGWRFSPLRLEGWLVEERVSKNREGARGSAQQVSGREVSALDTGASPSLSSLNIYCDVPPPPPRGITHLNFSPTPWEASVLMGSTGKDARDSDPGELLFGWRCANSHPSFPAGRGWGSGSPGDGGHRCQPERWRRPLFPSAALGMRSSLK